MDSYLSKDMFITALYRTVSFCLLALGLCACVATAPYQAVSNAKQTLQSAQKYLQNDTDKADYTTANELLIKAETAISQGDYNTARTYLQQSQDKAQGIVNRYNTPNYKFRY